MNWQQTAEEYQAVAREVFGPLKDILESMAAELSERLGQGNKIMICGNGGSAADAQHMAGELVNRFFKERRPYAGIALSADTSVLTCISNDYAYDQVFEKQVEALGKAGDVLIGISTSGNAANVCKAVEKARDMDILTIGMTGGEGGSLLKMADRAIRISSSSSTPRIQEGHQLAYHILCERIEEILS